jgi:hypothetical protein
MPIYCVSSSYFSLQISFGTQNLSAKRKRLGLWLVRRSPVLIELVIESSSRSSWVMSLATLTIQVSFQSVGPYRVLLELDLSILPVRPFSRCPLCDNKMNFVILLDDKLACDLAMQICQNEPSYLLSTRRTYNGVSMISFFVPRTIDLGFHGDVRQYLSNHVGGQMRCSVQEHSPFCTIWHICSMSLDKDKRTQ